MNHNGPLRLDRQAVLQREHTISKGQSRRCIINSVADFKQNLILAKFQPVQSCWSIGVDGQDNAKRRLPNRLKKKKKEPPQDSSSDLGNFLIACLQNKRTEFVIAQRQSWFTAQFLCMTSRTTMPAAAGCPHNIPASRPLCTAAAKHCSNRAPNWTNRADAPEDGGEGPKIRFSFLLNATGTELINFLQPTGHVMHQQFNIQQLYVLPTLYSCGLYLSENKQRLVPLTA